MCITHIVSCIHLIPSMLILTIIWKLFLLLNLEDAVNAGVFGAPFFVTDDGARFWGQDRIDALDRHLAG
mgnify:CR=1 FL=1